MIGIRKVIDTGEVSKGALYFHFDSKDAAVDARMDQIRKSEIGEDIADGGGELEAVAGAGRGEHRLWHAGHRIDDEALIGRDGVDAALHRQRVTRRVRDVACQALTDQAELVRARRPVGIARVHRLAPEMRPAELEAGMFVEWEAVEGPFLDTEDA